jgi:hypothetical protein
MSKEQTKDLLKFLKPFSAEIQDIVLSLREYVWDMYPQTNELIYDNYNALAFGWSPTDRVGHTFCSIAVGRTSNNIHFGFYWGSEIADPRKLLIGQRQPIQVHSGAKHRRVSKAVHQKARTRSLSKFSEKGQGQKTDH